jgi:hypothetical protein
VSLIALTAFPALSQTAAPVPVACPAGGGSSGGGQFTQAESIMTYNLPQLPHPALAGAPYTGQTSYESIRTLANGTHLTQPARLSPMMYRDSMGRTRTDAMTMPPRPGTTTPQINRLAEIDDPVAGYRYILDDYHKVAHRIVPCKRSPPAARVQPVPASNPGPARMGGNSETEDLGTQTMFGVTVTGVRNTITFPPGSYQGNDGPVITIQETWRSAQYGLEFVVKNSRSDGDSTQTMTSFTAGEPDPSLFQVPSGYQIVDDTANFTITIPYQPQ